MNIPVIINNRNLLTWPKAMVEKIKTYKGVGEIIIVDNDSDYPPLLDWYKTNPCIIIKKDNLGYLGPWTSKTVSGLNVPYYVVTDSDMGLEDTPEDTLLYFKDKIEELNLEKVGFGLDWKRVVPESPYYNHMQGYEKNRWEGSAILSGVAVDVPIDTTFALYKRQEYFIGGGSTIHPYIARHHPWELTKEQYDANEEFKYYIKSASPSCSYKYFLNLQ
jgi:hypothetical protein